MSMLPMLISNMVQVSALSYIIRNHLPYIDFHHWCIRPNEFLNLNQTPQSTFSISLLIRALFPYYFRLVCL